MLNVATLAPIPRPNVMTAAAVKPGARLIKRSPCAKSCRKGVTWSRRRGCGDYTRNRTLRHDEPRHQIGQDTEHDRAGHNRGNRPHEPHQSRVHGEILGEAAADAGNLAIADRAMEPT